MRVADKDQDYLFEEADPSSGELPTGDNYNDDSGYEDLEEELDLDRDDEMLGKAIRDPYTRKRS